MKKMKISIHDILDASLKGKCDGWSEFNYKVFLAEQDFTSKEKLKILLDGINAKIDEFEDSFFISEYDKLCKEGCDNQEMMDDLYHEERSLEEEGKECYTLDSLYQLMDEQGMFFNEIHEENVYEAYETKNCRLLKYYYEIYVLKDINLFKECVEKMLDTLEDKESKNSKNTLEKGFWGIKLALFYHYTLKTFNIPDKERKEKILSMFNKPIILKTLNNNISKLECYLEPDSEDKTKNETRLSRLEEVLRLLEEHGYDTWEIKRDIKI